MKRVAWFRKANSKSKKVVFIFKKLDKDGCVFIHLQNKDLVRNKAVERLDFLFRCFLTPDPLSHNQAKKHGTESQ